ncbi:MAG: hypothetical protein H6629_18120 [Calditrichae bacterium]|nr:hypothetical protein [Calditrichia bacterium]
MAPPIMGWQKHYRELNDKTQLIFGYRWQHFSNGTGIVPTNPSYNGNGIFLGFRFKPNRK